MSALACEKIALHAGRLSRNCQVWYRRTEPMLQRLETILKDSLSRRSPGPVNTVLRWRNLRAVNILKESLGRRFPGPVNTIQRWRNLRALNALPSLAAIDLGRLPRSSEIATPARFLDDSIMGESESVQAAIESAFPRCFTKRDGGAGREDARALWYWVRRFKPQSVLEIGTGSGVTTSHMAMALKQCHGVVPPSPPPLDCSR